MTARLPSVKAREVIAALEKAGWYVHEMRGPHAQLKHDEQGGRVTVPVHPGDVPRRIVHQILKQAGMTVEEFRELL